MIEDHINEKKDYNLLNEEFPIPVSTVIKEAEDHIDLNNDGKLLIFHDHEDSSSAQSQKLPVSNAKKKRLRVSIQC